MGLSWSHILIVVLLFVLLFGRNKISELMGDLAKGIKSFKAGMADDEPDVIEHKPEKPKPAKRTAARSRKSG
ncbi:MAG: twin-arginine translocase TatA/TatE family subunit [Hyphomonas sp.]|uniref:twin-arginine translocase TatA/TatE family subunit n=1 Tax=Hyphomonas sp. TaxID=87 RepID=UPI0034A04E06